MTDTTDAADAKPFRLLPRLDETNEYFWTSGADGVLRFLRCQDCAYWIHPWSPRCPTCLSKNLAPDAVGGAATLHAFTINHQPWIPGLDPPYVIAIVEFPEQVGLRLTTSLVDVEFDAISIGMPLRVVFDNYEDVWLPLFAPGTSS